jgi:hypothetical protein
MGELRTQKACRLQAFQGAALSWLSVDVVVNETENWRRSVVDHVGGNQRVNQIKTQARIILSVDRKQSFGIANF